MNIIVTNPKFPSALRLHLTSHKNALKIACLTFLGMLITETQQEYVINFLSEIGILGKILFLKKVNLDFVYDCFDDQIDIAK